MTRTQVLCSLVALVAALLLGVGCGSSGGGSGVGATSPASAGNNGGGTLSGSTVNPPSGFTGTDITDPSLTPDAASGPNSFLSGQGAVLSGHAYDTESGVSTVEVNGVPAFLSGSVSDTTWQIAPSLSDGVNVVEVVVTDQQGNQTSEWWGVFYAERYLNPADPVPNAGVIYVTDDGFDKIAELVSGFLVQGNSLVQALLNTPLTAQLIPGVNMSIVSFSYSAPAGQQMLTMRPLATGIEATLVMENVVMSIDLGGLGTVSYTDPHVEATGVLHVAVSQGTYVVTMPSCSVRLTPAPGSQLQLGNSVPGWVSGLLGGLVPTLGNTMGAAVQGVLPGAMQRALNSFTPSYSQDIMGVTFTATAQPSAISYSTDGVEIDIESNLTSSAAGTMGGPGSLGFTGVGAPPLSQAHQFTVATHVAMVNRAIYAAWDSGILSYTIDQSMLSQYGINLPFQLDGRWFALFFPALQSLMPSNGQPVPIGLQFGFELPPSVDLDAQTPNLRGAYAGCHASIVMDFGAGYQPVLSLDVAGEFAADAQTSASAIDLSLQQPITFRFGVTASGNPLNLNTRSVNTFMNTALGMLVSFAGNLLPSIPIPALPAFGGAQMQLQQLDTEFDREYVTIKASFR